MQILIIRDQLTRDLPFGLGQKGLFIQKNPGTPEILSLLQKSLIKVVVINQVKNKMKVVREIRENTDIPIILIAENLKESILGLSAKPGWDPLIITTDLSEIKLLSHMLIKGIPHCHTAAV